MHKLPQINLPRPGNRPEMPSELPVPISKQLSPEQMRQREQAARAADRLFDLLPLQDVGDPHAFLREVISIFESYPVEIMWEAARRIPQENDRPSLKFIREFCDDRYGPELCRVRWQKQIAETIADRRPHRTAEQQARVDAQIAAYQVERKLTDARILEDEALREARQTAERINHGYPPTGLPAAYNRVGR